jgi:membrane-bound lytic murein transglycosylase D
MVSDAPELDAPSFVDSVVQPPMGDAGSAHAVRDDIVDPAPVPPPPVKRDGPTYPVVVNSEVQHFLDRFTGERRDLVGLWINRSSRYLGMMREVLKSRGMPEDLAFTAMIESGFNPVAVSRAGAVGLWQFMAGTARRYGLRVDKWVDERRDPEKSTFAAAAYLNDLYRQFGSWWLAQAAYNAGEMNVAKAIKATGSKDFWVLAQSRFLHRETKEFVPRIQAAAVIGRDPLRYGFDTRDATVTGFEKVSVPASTDLKSLAQSSGVAFDMLRSLNPTLVREVTPPDGPYDLRVPLGTGTGVLAALDEPRRQMVARRTASVDRASLRQTSATSKSDVHVVRPRDTVSSIAKRYGISTDDVLRWNQIDKPARIRPGDRLRVADSRVPYDRERHAGGR